MKPSPKQNGDRPRAERLEDIFTRIERGTPRGFTHIKDVLPAVFQRIIRASRVSR